jgi:Rne/Rng family ribonuclease
MYKLGILVCQIFFNKRNINPMGKEILIDVCPEEVRVAVLSDHRLEDFFSEISQKKQLKGNLYLGLVTNVEPALQAVFVNFGQERHGFLPFSEIHPDYFNGAVSDQKKLQDSFFQKMDALDQGIDSLDVSGIEADLRPEDISFVQDSQDGSSGVVDLEEKLDLVSASHEEELLLSLEGFQETPFQGNDDLEDEDSGLDLSRKEEKKIASSFRIQDVIKKNQVLLVQVVKDPRGQKGAALTTYISLPGRYCVLLPNTPNVLGVSKKIGSSKERDQLRSVVEMLQFPKSKGLIVRTAGQGRTKTELKRDSDYLLRLWGEIRQTIESSVAPSLVYEEADLITRCLRDLYTSDVEKVWVQGEEGYKKARQVMGLLMPSHRRRVQLHKEPQSLFDRFAMEEQIRKLYEPVVQLPSGGYLVIHPTEALTAIDVNSGRAVKERNIEETAFRSNLEAAEEVPRQLRKRDVGGLVVIDFIDMSSKKNVLEVEKRLKDGLEVDRARIQVGSISQFGLLELSRQRLRPSILENATVVCPACHGQGTVRSMETLSLEVLRNLKVASSGQDLLLTAFNDLAFFLLNQKRKELLELEQLDIRVQIKADGALSYGSFVIEPLVGQEEEKNQDQGRKKSVHAKKPVVQSASGSKIPGVEKGLGSSHPRSKNNRLKKTNDLIQEADLVLQSSDQSKVQGMGYQTGDRGKKKILSSKTSRLKGPGSLGGKGAVSLEGGMLEDSTKYSKGKKNPPSHSKSVLGNKLGQPKKISTGTRGGLGIGNNLPQTYSMGPLSWDVDPGNSLEDLGKIGPMPSLVPLSVVMALPEPLPEGVETQESTKSKSRRNRRRRPKGSLEGGGVGGNLDRPKTFEEKQGESPDHKPLLQGDRGPEEESRNIPALLVGQVPEEQPLASMGPSKRSASRNRRRQAARLRKRSALESPEVPSPGANPSSPEPLGDVDKVATIVEKHGGTRVAQETMQGKEKPEAGVAGSFPKKSRAGKRKPSKPGGIKTLGKEIVVNSDQKPSLDGGSVSKKPFPKNRLENLSSKIDLNPATYSLHNADPALSRKQSPGKKSFS